MRPCDLPRRSQPLAVTCPIRAWVLSLLGVAIALQVSFPAQAQDEGPAVGRGVQFLKSQVPTLWTGEAALVALTLHKAEVPNDDPALGACLAKIFQRFSQTGYTPERDNAPGLYEAAVTIIALVNIDPTGYKPLAEQATRWLVSKQKSSGGWDYDERSAGDASITQYAVLGLWEAENAGIAVPPQLWDRVAAWYISVQYPDGGWRYHHDEPQWIETVSMTAAGVGSLLVCQRQLAKYRRGADSIHPLMTPLIQEGTPIIYRPQTSAAQINGAVRKGISWLGGNFDLSRKEQMGQSNFYGLYGIERIGALADRQTLGGVDWFARGRSYILGNQLTDGSWKDYHGIVPNTCWAILFVVRATAKSVQKIEVRRLGGGTLLGGRGLPSDLNQLTIAQGRVMVRPMSGAVESMIAVLEDPSALQAEAALGGLVERYHVEGEKALKPFKDRFLKLMKDPDPSIRRVAAWALSRTGDLDLAPQLITLLQDPVEDVMTEARLGLQFLSRIIDGYGPPAGPTPEQRAEAIKKWREWYLRSQSSSADVDLPLAPSQVPRDPAANSATPAQPATNSSAPPPTSNPAHTAPPQPSQNPATPSTSSPSPGGGRPA